MDDKFELLRKQLEQQVKDTIVARGEDSPNLNHLFSYLRSLQGVNDVGNDQNFDILSNEISILGENILTSNTNLGESILSSKSSTGLFTNLSGRTANAKESILLAEANPNRALLIIQNRSIHPIYIEFGEPATIDRSLSIDMGETFTLDKVIDIRDIYIISSSANTPYVAVEVTRL